MPLPKHRRYFLHIDDEPEDLDDAGLVENRILAALDRSKGRLSLYADGGDRPFWHRLFGARIWVVGYFSVEWYNGIAALMFLDDNMSEYRAVDRQPVLDYSQSDHNRIRFGGDEPIDRRFTMSTTRAKEAIKQFLQTSRRPSWLDYELVE